MQFQDLLSHMVNKYNLKLKEFFKMHEKILRNFSLFYKVLIHFVRVIIMELKNFM